MVLLVLTLVEGSAMALWVRWYQVEWRSSSGRREKCQAAPPPTYLQVVPNITSLSSAAQLYPKLDLSLKPPSQPSIEGEGLNPAHF